MMLWKCCTQYASKFEKLSSRHRNGKGQFAFQPQRSAMPRNVPTNYCSTAVSVWNALYGSDIVTVFHPKFLVYRLRVIYDSWTV